MSSLHSKSLFLILLSLLVIYAHSSQFNYFQYGARLIPHPKKVEKGGEDAFFANSHVLAVADGVGSWNKKGIDPSKYSKELCNLVGVLLEEKNNTYVNKPKAIIREAVKRNTNPGTSTLVIANLDKKKPILRTSYVGDSLYVLYRKQDGVWKAIFEAAGQLVSFNSPFQLGYKTGANPNRALEFSHDVQDKDILVVASDGIFDNLTADQILEELLKFVGANDELQDAEQAAYNITEAAFKLSLDRTYNSPFSAKTAEATKNVRLGGKSDDITAIVGQVRIPTKKIVKKENAKKVENITQINLHEATVSKTFKEMKAKMASALDL